MVAWLLDTKPYEVQLEALRRATDRNRFGFFLDIGLGKTSTCLAEFVGLLNENKCNSMAIVAPNSLKETWEIEAKERNIPVPVVHSPDRVPSSWNSCIYTINYEAVIAAAGEHLEEFLADNQIYLVLDESIMIKNFKSKRTKRIRNLAPSAAYIRLLSGEPQVQSPFDLYPQLRILGADIPTNPYAFRNRYCIMGGFKNKQIVGARNEKDLAEKVASVAFVAEAKDWSDLPEKLFSVRHYEMSPPQLHHYREMLTEMMTEINNEEISVQQAITKSIKLQQIASGFIIDEIGTPHSIVDRHENPKFKALLELLQNHPNNKFIIVCHYNRTLDSLIEHFNNPPFIRGGMTRDEITEAKERFNRGDARELLLQSAAGKYGHTLLGDQDNFPCHHMVFYENTYNLDNRIQGEGRIRRHGQNYRPTYIDFIGCPEEKKIVTALQRKLNMAQIIKQLIMQYG